MSSAGFEWQIAWRYLRGARGARRNGFIGFISMVSIIGVVLGVAALVVSTAVINGFSRDVRDRMLSVIPHIEIIDAAGKALSDWRAIAQTARDTLGDDVAAASPFIAVDSAIARGDELRGAVVRGISPEDETPATALGSLLRRGELKALQPGAQNMLMGRALAQQLALKVGDDVAMVTRPAERNAGVTVNPMLTRFTIAGVFESGHHQYDSAWALIHWQDAARVLRVEGATGVQLQLKNHLDARRSAQRLADVTPAGVVLRDWTMSNANWFTSVQIQKRMIFIILLLIAAVAAFNLVATLVMTVTDKRGDIAILRTLGASPRSVMGIFVAQGAAAGAVGMAIGVALGLLIAFNVDVIVSAIEKLLSVSLLPSSIYFINYMPSDPRLGDIVPIGLISLALAFVATLYPSWRASRVNPAEALRYE
jgi:lipoprotein-releasing system permease protein